MKYSSCPRLYSKQKTWGGGAGHSAAPGRKAACSTPASAGARWHLTDWIQAVLRTLNLKTIQMLLGAAYYIIKNLEDLFTRL